MNQAKDIRCERGHIPCPYRSCPSCKRICKQLGIEKDKD